MATPHHAENLIWLDQMAVVVPGYNGYSRREHRREAAYALRDALVRRLEILKRDVREAIQACIEHEALSEIGALERIDLHIDRILERLRNFGHLVEEFYSGPDLDPHRLEPLHALDHGVIETAEHLAHYFQKPNPDHDRLAEIQQQLTHLESQLDKRVQLLHSLH